MPKYRGYLLSSEQVPVLDRVVPSVGTGLIYDKDLCGDVLVNKLIDYACTLVGCSFDCRNQGAKIRTPEVPYSLTVSWEPGGLESLFHALHSFFLHGSRRLMRFQPCI